MASFHSDSGSVSYHTDTPGVSITRARFERASELMAKNHQSPGPATYASRELTKASPLKAGIKFSLSKKPPGLFDVPDSRICPGPGQYDAGHKPLGVAEFRSLKSSSAFVSPSGAVASTGTPRRGHSFDKNSSHSQGSNGSHFPTSARRYGLPPRSPHPNASNSSLDHSVASLSDISNASTHDVKDRSFKGDNHYSEELPRLDTRLVDASTLSKVRAKLAAALYTGIGTHYQDKAAFFGAVDKNHDGFLDLSETISMCRRVLKLSRDEVSDVQVKAIFSALGGRKRHCLDFHQFFALLGSSTDDNAPAGEGEASKKTRRPSPRPLAQSPRSSLENNVSIPKKSRQSSSPASKPMNNNRTYEASTSAMVAAAPLEPSAKEPMSSSSSSTNEAPAALTDMMNDLKQLHGDFDAQLEELGEISKVLDQLLNTMH